MSPTVALSADDVPRVLDTYATRGEVRVPAGDGRTIAVTRKREPLLEVDERVTLPGGVVTFPAHAPLGQVRRTGQVLHFGRQRVRLANVAGGRLVFGCVDDVQRIEAWGPASADCNKALLPAAVHDSSLAGPFERRHYLGVQVGGTGWLQIDYRFRMLGRLHLDIGFFGSNGTANGSAGLLYDAPVSRRIAPYVGAGGGFVAAFGETSCEGDPGCVDASTLTFVYVRLGIEFRLGDMRRDVLGIDVGAWRGEAEDETVRDAIVNRRSVLWPMAGLSYHYAL